MSCLVSEFVTCPFIMMRYDVDFMMCVYCDGVDCIRYRC